VARREDLGGASTPHGPAGGRRLHRPRRRSSRQSHRRRAGDATCACRRAAVMTIVNSEAARAAASGVRADRQRGEPIGQAGAGEEGAGPGRAGRPRGSPSRCRSRRRVAPAARRRGGAP
jgi:hypothetical protein